MMGDSELSLVTCLTYLSSHQHKVCSRRLLVEREGDIGVKLGAVVKWRHGGSLHLATAGAERHPSAQGLVRSSLTSLSCGSFCAT